MSDVAPPLLTGRGLALVVLSVLLVGVGSALATMVFLTNQNDARAMPESKQEADPTPPSPDEASEPSSKTPVDAPPVAPTAPAVESPPTPAPPPPAAPVDSEGSTGSVDPVAEGEPAQEDVGSESGSTGQEERLDAGDEESAEASRDATGAGERSRPMHETAECTQMRANADAALTERAWGRLVELTRKRWCWPSAQQPQRVRLRIRALTELQRFADCVKAGDGSKDPEVQRMVTTCKKLM